MIVSLDVQHGELLRRDVHASTEEAGCNAALVYVALDHFGGIKNVE